MLTYINIGPYRSGTTSFYKMFINNKVGVNIGKQKEPFQKFQNSNLIIDDYLKNWDLNNNHNIILDASGDLFKQPKGENFVKQTKNMISLYRIICLIRNPIKYYTTVIYFDIKKYNNMVSLSTEEINNEINIRIKNKKYLYEKYGYLSYLKLIEKQIDKKNIFILPIEFFNQYKLELSNFLNINMNNFIFPFIESYNVKKIIKFTILHKLISNSDFKNYVLDEFIIMDKEYKTNLFNLYNYILSYKGESND